MKSSTSSPKRSAKNYFEEITSFDLFYQLIHMSATSAAGISRARVFQLARQLPCPPSQYFKAIHEVAENLRYNYPDAVRMIGERVKSSQEVKTFLLRLSDALRSGEPLPGFLSREASVQGDHYSNDYETKLESLKKWSDAYTAVSVSAALIVIMNMVMTMIYNVGVGMMAMMVMVAVAGSFGVAWVMFRTAPETVAVPLALGSKEQRLTRKLFFICMPITIIVVALLWLIGVPQGWILIAAGIFMLPIGIAGTIADSKVAKKDSEISPFLRSLGGTATSRGTTLKEALLSMKKDSFPALYTDIRTLVLRLTSFIEPGLCWRSFATETGSKLAEQSTGIFIEAVGLGGDPEKTGGLTSMFAMRTAMLRAKRRGVAGSFSYLAMVMHGVMAGLMVFLLGILEQFAVKLNEAMSSLGEGPDAMSGMGLQSMFSFNAPQIQFLTMITVGMIIFLAIVNSFAIVACEGSHLIKITFYLSILLAISGVIILLGPSMVKLVM
ncbi:MAG: type II secretion system F family protein [Chloroflexi bacterium]|nr:type II secretion system F family protein [Chloroflexota bacterium]